jgi:hypothetical protein
MTRQKRKFAERFLAVQQQENDGDASSQPGAGLKLGPHAVKPIPADALWLTSTQVRNRYGGVSAMWLWNRVEHDADFPKPAYFGNRQMFSVAELDAYDRLVLSRRVEV